MVIHSIGGKVLRTQMKEPIIEEDVQDMVQKEEFSKKEAEDVKEEPDSDLKRFSKVLTGHVPNVVQEEEFRNIIRRLIVKGI